MVAVIASLGVLSLVVLGLLIMTGTIGPDQMVPSIGRAILFAITAFFLIYLFKLLLLSLICILQPVLSLLFTPLVLAIEILALLSVTSFVIRGRKKEGSRKYDPGGHRE
jgi:hypothetical protein